MPIVTAYTAHAPVDRVREVLTDVFSSGGWRVVDGGTAAEPQGSREFVVERGSRAKSLLLGGGAGDDFYLRHTLTLTPVPDGGEGEGPGATEITYPTSGGSSVARGGSRGAHLEMSLYDDYSVRIRTALEEAGIAVGLR